MQAIFICIILKLCCSTEKLTSVRLWTQPYSQWHGSLLHPWMDGAGHGSSLRISMLLIVAQWWNGGPRSDIRIFGSGLGRHVHCCAAIHLNMAPGSAMKSLTHCAWPKIDEYIRAHALVPFQSRPVTIFYGWLATLCHPSGGCHPGTVCTPHSNATENTKCSIYLSLIF